MKSAIALTFLALVTSVMGSGADAATSQPSRSAEASYGWPLKPFDRPHPVRGGFGDPRTVFAGPPTQSTVMTGSGAFQFHFGIDISAPDDTAVYPVESGTVTTVSPEWIQVDSGTRSFQYWHIRAAVSVGQHVEVDATVLGHILREAGHVHLTEIDNRVVVNPLAPGHLGPYVDHTVPRVASVEFRNSLTGPDLMPELLRGNVEMIASAYDTPAMAVPGAWHGLPVTPTLVGWRIRSARTGAVVVPEHIVYDVRQALPSNAKFWLVYARGTHQNMSVFGTHYSYMQPGAFLFRLAPGGFDTRTLGDDVYDLVVTAIDIRGNESSLAQRFSVHNKPGVIGV